MQNSIPALRRGSRGLGCGAGTRAARTTPTEVQRVVSADGSARRAEAVDRRAQCRSSGASSKRAPGAMEKIRLPVSFELDTLRMRGPDLPRDL